MRLAWQLLRIPPVPYLPPSNSRPYTLAIELDETLIHYEVESKTLKYRPYLDILLRKLEPNFEIVAFCAGTQQYAHLMAKQIEKGNRFFSFVLSEQHIGRQGLKDLARLGRDMNRVVAVDCRPQNYPHFKAQGVEVKEWKGDRSDK